MLEVKNNLELFVKDMSPGPDGWMVEFYWHLFYLFGQDIIEAVEES